MKDELRKRYLNIRKNITNRDILDNNIYKKIINHEKINSCETILIYVSYNYEVDTLKIIKYFLNKKKVAVPKICENEMKFYYINSFNDLSIGKYGILEPTTKEEVNDFNNAICITPGICFNKDGYRIGYGKGYYDRFFDKHNLYKIGLCYKECLITNKFNSNFDKKVDEIITE